jgi:hypothetical protein
MLTSHRQKYNPKKPNANLRRLLSIFKVFPGKFYFFAQTGKSRTYQIQVSNARQKKIPLRAFTEKDIIKTRFIYLDLNTSEKR